MIGTMESIVTGVEPRIIKEGKPDQRTVYDVLDQQGEKYTAWEKDLAEAAWNLKGQPSVWKVKVEQNGKYTNRTLMEIAARTGATSMMQEATSSFPTAPAPAPAPALGPSSFEVAIQSPTEKDTMIWRQVATKVAATLGPKNEIEFWGNVLQLMSFYETGVLPFKTGGNETVISPEVQAAMDPFQPVPDDDIPF